MAINLCEVWGALTTTLNENKSAWWTKINDRLSESRRRYHNLSHLENKYRLYNEIKQLLHNKEAVEFALFFSYFEYEPQAIETDVKNIEHFKMFCRECGIDLDSDLCKDVIDLLSCMGNHMTDEHLREGVYGSEDKHYFLDLDMAILGSPREIYLDYAQKVSEEYDFLCPEVYKGLRLKVLLAFLQIPNIFATKEFREKFEEQARKNIQEEINAVQT